MALLLLGSAIIAAGVVLAVVLIPGGGTGGPHTAAGSHSAATTTAGSASSSAAQSTASSSAATTTSSAATSSVSAAGGGTVTAADVRNFITGYYALLPGDPEQAWNLTGPTLRSAESHDNYIAFWHRFSSVRLGPITAEDGSLVAHGQVTYVENGAAQPEQHTFTLVRGADGQLLMDSDRQT